MPPLRIALSARDRRALRLGLFVIGPVLAWNLIVRPYTQAMRETTERLQVQRELLSKELQLLGSASQYPKVLSRAERTLDATAARLFSGPDDVSATAALAYYVSDHARKARVLVQQVETRNSEPIGDGIVGLDMGLRAEGDLEGIVALLRKLESGPKLVRIEQLTVEQASSGGDVPSQSETLSIAATIRGYAPQRTDSTSAADQPKIDPRGQRGSE
jgi:hypothetical protein